jgi:4-carboxymuconolactone decarboxylase
MPGEAGIRQALEERQQRAALRRREIKPTQPRVDAKGKSGTYNGVPFPGAMPMATQDQPRPPASVAKLAPKLNELTQEVLFGDIWERKELSKRDRSLLTCAVLTALYRQDQLRFHVKLAITNGVKREELAEMMTHVAFYAGWPCGVQALQTMSEALNEGA